jgi:hypothetical protein
MTRFITRACLAASAVLCFAIEPASSQYNIFNSQSGLVTDVIVNGQRESLASVRQFERRCQIGMAAGRWWMDQNGNLGPVGGPATYNINTCQELEQEGSAAPEKKTENRCTIFPGQGSICSGPGFR